MEAWSYEKGLLGVSIGKSPDGIKDHKNIPAKRFKTRRGLVDAVRDGNFLRVDRRKSSES